MNKIAWISDSTCDIPKALCEAHDIGIVPVHLIVGNEVYKEYYEMTPERFWQILVDCTEVPTTAQITPVEWLAAFAEKRQTGCTHIIGFTMNGDGSGGFRSACAAREEFYETYGRDITIEIFDSRSYSFVFGRVIVEAAEQAETGMAFAEVCDFIRERLCCVEAFVGIYDLKVVRKSGRISGAAALLGGALGLKPVAHVYDGGVPVCSKARGTKGMLDKLIHHIRERAKAPENQTAYLLHAIVPPEDVETLESRLKTEVGFARVERMALGATITANTGGRAIGVAFYGNPH